MLPQSVSWPTRDQSTAVMLDRQPPPIYRRILCDATLQHVRCSCEIYSLTHRALHPFSFAAFLFPAAVGLYRPHTRLLNMHSLHLRLTSCDFGPSIIMSAKKLCVYFMMFSVYRLLSRVCMRSHVKGELVDHPFFHGASALACSSKRIEWRGMTSSLFHLSQP